MLRCPDCESLILDHLYGLLDAAEAAEVDAHLASCPACSAARTQAAKLQGLIAEAAKGEFPHVRFESPAARPKAAPASPPRTPAPIGEPVALPATVADLATPAPTERGAGGAGGTAPGSTLRSRSLRVGIWLPWAVAAAVLVAIPGTVVPVLGVLDRAETARRGADESTANAADVVNRFETAKREADRHQAQVARRLVEASQTPDGILKAWVAAEKAIGNAPEDRRATWEVMKPASTQPGAPNEFLVVVNQFARDTHGKFVAEFRDQNDAVVYSEQLVPSQRQQTVRLPVNVWSKLTPQSELFLTVTNVDDVTHQKTELQDKVRLFGPVYATVLATDKPAYRPGETIRFRSLTLDRVTFSPPTREQVFRYELLGPNGQPVCAGVTGGTDLVRVRADSDKAEPVLGPDGKPVRGVGTGEFLLPTETPDGDYTLVLRELPHAAGYPPAVPLPVERALRVRAGAVETYAKQTKYFKESYSQGDLVEARVELKLQDKPVEGAELRDVVAEVDNRRVPVTATPATDASGNATLRFVLPPNIDRGDVRLKATFRTKDGEETVASRVPVVGSQLVVEFFPEGGSLIAGAPCRVYVRATTPSGHPVAISGVITDGRTELAAVETATGTPELGANRGIGAFTFTPKLGTPVWLKLKTPAQASSPILVPHRNRVPVASAAVAGGAAVVASRTGFLLPEPKDEGVAMTVLDPVTEPGKPIRVHLRSVAQTRNLVVGAYTRGRLSDTQRVTAKVGEVAEVQLMAGTDPRGGVVRITVFEEPAGGAEADKAKADLFPVAERLVFRKPGEALNLNFAVAGAKGAGGEGLLANSLAELDVTATNEKGKPAAAVLYAAVVNTAVAPGAKDRLLTTHFLISGEISTPDAMEYADFLLTDHPRANETLDLVLATQGWRRFAEQTRPGYATQPVVANRESANLLVCNGQYLTSAEPNWVREHRKLYETYWPKYESALKSLDAARAAAESARAELATAEGDLRELAAVATRAGADAKAHRQGADAATESVNRFRGSGWFAVAAFGLLSLLLGGAALARLGSRLPLGIGTVGSLGLVAFLVFALTTAERSHAASVAARQAGVATNVGQWDAPALPASAPANEVAPHPREATDDGRPIKDFDPTKGQQNQNLGRPPFGPMIAPKFIFPGAPAGPKGGNMKGDKFPPGPPPGGFAGGGFGGAPGSGGFGGPPGPPAGLGGTGGGGTGAPPGGGGPRPNGGVVPGLPGFTVPWNVPLGAAAPEVVAGGLGGAPPGALPPAGEVHPGKGGGRGAGWQPNDGRQLVPNELLDKATEVDYFQTQRDRKKADGFPAAGVAAPASAGAGGGAGTGLPPGGGASTLAKPAAVSGVASSERDAAKLREDEKESLLRATNAAKQYSFDRSDRLNTALERSFGKRSEMGLGALPVVPPAAQAKGASVPVPDVAPGRSETLALSRIRASVPSATPLVVREYAAPRPGTQLDANGGHEQEPDTVLWQPVIVLPADGKVKLTVPLGSARGGYQVLIAGHTLDGRLGAVRGTIPVAPVAPATSATPVPPTAPAAPTAPTTPPAP